MLSIEVKNNASTNSADVSIEMQGAGSDIVTEIVLGSITALRKVTGEQLTYQEAANLLRDLIADYKDFEEV